jgi:hypothetical protein
MSQKSKMQGTNKGINREIYVNKEGTESEEQ